jgi:hypothetical protein
MYPGLRTVHAGDRAVGLQMADASGLRSHLRDRARRAYTGQKIKNKPPVGRGFRRCLVIPTPRAGSGHLQRTGAPRKPDSAPSGSSKASPPASVDSGAACSLNRRRSALRDLTMHWHGLRDDRWDWIKDLLPHPKGWVGVTAANNRLSVQVVLYRYHTLTRSAEALRQPNQCPPAVSRYAKFGYWRRVLEHLPSDTNNDYAMIDSTIMRPGSAGGGHIALWQPLPLIAAPGAHLYRRREAVHHHRLRLHRERPRNPIRHFALLADRDPLSAERSPPGSEIRVG